MGNPKYNKRPTETEIKKLLDILGRGYPNMSERMKQDAREIMLKEINYEPKRPPDRIVTELVLIYALEVYGKGKLSKGNDSPLVLEKGITGEAEAIKMLSAKDGIEYTKNEGKKTNKWFVGRPDIIVRSENGKVSKIIDIKVSFDLPSFILTKFKQENPDNVYELWGYMDLFGCKEGEIVHCLVDMPENISAFEEKRIRERNQTMGINPEYSEERIAYVLNNMQYSDIPMDARIFRRSFSLNKLAIKDAKRKATSAKKWIESIHKMFTKNELISGDVETGSSNAEENSI